MSSSSAPYMQLVDREESKPTQAESKVQRIRTAHYCDWDRTAVKDHTNEWREFVSDGDAAVTGHFTEKAWPGRTPLSKEQCTQLIKPELLETCRAVWAADDYFAFITNGSAYRIRHVLENVGATEDELKKLVILSGESTFQRDGFKPQAIKQQAAKWPDAMRHVFYDDNMDFARQVYNIKKHFQAQGKELIVYPVPAVPEYVDHLKYAQNVSKGQVDAVSYNDMVRLKAKLENLGIVHSYLLVPEPAPLSRNPAATFSVSKAAQNSTPPSDENSCCCVVM